MRSNHLHWILFVIFLNNAPSFGDDDAFEREVRAQAELYHKAIRERDFEKAANFAHPQIAKQLGGRSGVIKSYRSAFDQLKSSGVEFQNSTVEEIGTPLTSKSDLYVIVTHTTEATSDEGTLTIKSYLLGIKNKRSQKWSFTGGSIGEKELRKIFPDIPLKLNFPEPESPIPKDDTKQQ